MEREVRKEKYSIPIEIENLQFYDYPNSFELESGEVLEELRIAYHTFGKINAAKDNVIWVCHALTANSDVLDWWPGLFGAGHTFDPQKHFIVCANILGSCYGTTGARSINPQTGVAYGLDFPATTIRDLVRVHDLLRAHLGIEQINLCIGGSCGGHQVLEYGVLFPTRIQRMVALVTSARESAWSIAIHEGQRMSLEADPSFYENTDKAGSKGLRAARGNALLNYRTLVSYNASQTDEDLRKDDFRASSYIRYQGLKLEKRFYAHCYYRLLKTLDTHHLGRDRESIESVLQKLKIPILVLAVDTDQLIPSEEQLFLARHLPMSTYKVIQSDFGHDGFLIEAEKIAKAIKEWLE